MDISSLLQRPRMSIYAFLYPHMASANNFPLLILQLMLRLLITSKVVNSLVKYVQHFQQKHIGKQKLKTAATFLLIMSAFLSPPLKAVTHIKALPQALMSPPFSITTLLVQNVLMPPITLTQAAIGVLNEHTYQTNAQLTVTLVIIVSHAPQALTLTLFKILNVFLIPLESSNVQNIHQRLSVKNARPLITSAVLLVSFPKQQSHIALFTMPIIVALNAKLVISSPAAHHVSFLMPLIATNNWILTHVSNATQKMTTWAL